MQRCWAAEVSPCRGSISGEHYITRGLWLSPTVTVEGLGPEPIELSIDSLTTNSLCEGHNHALSDLDQAAIDFVNAIRRLNELKAVRQKLVVARSVAGPQPVALRVDMLRVERWALKTMINVARVLRTRLNDWTPPSTIPPVVFGRASLARGVGLGIAVKVGDRIENAERVGLGFGKRPNDAGPTAFQVTLQNGYRFVVTWDAPFEDFVGFLLDGRVYAGDADILWHPNRVIIQQPGVRVNLALEMNWTGKKPDRAVVKLRQHYLAPPR